MGRKKHKARLSAQTTKMIALRAPVTINADKKDESGEPALATFSATAYSGGLVPGYTASPQLPHPYVLDLKATKASRNVPGNLDHKSNQRVGHATEVSIDQSIDIHGVMSAETAHRDEVVKSSRNKHPWEISIEANLGKRRFIAAGKSQLVNGQTVQGPAFVFSDNLLTGFGFVSQGADDGNSLQIAASTAGAKNMNEFEKWLASCGIDSESLTDDGRANLEAAFKTKDKSTVVKQTSYEDELRSIQHEQDRKDNIQRIILDAVRDNPLHREQIVKLGDSALDDSKVEPRDFELDLLRGLRVPSGIFRSTMSDSKKAQRDPKVLEAAIALSAGMPNIEKHYSEQTLDSVERNGMRNFSLQKMLLQTASQNGYQVAAGDRIHAGNIRTVLEYCFPSAMQRAQMSGFSAVDIPGILGNVANKELLMGYMEEDQTWREISSVKSVNTFHTHTSYRMLDDLEYEEIGPAGEIKHGTLAQESFTRQARTYAKMLGLTRTDIINDDLGAFDDLRTRLGRGAAKKFNNTFWAAFMDNSSFFTTARTNYIEGATTNLGTDGVGLQLGITAYRKMTTPAADGSKRIGASMSRPTILLLPPELEFTGEKLHVSSNIVTGEDATMPDANIHVNKYRPVIQNRLSDAAFTGNSTTAWYLFGDELKPMVVSFLNGQQAPTVESTDADFDTLGILFRGYHDFGADQAEYLAGIKSKGAS